MAWATPKGFNFRSTAGYVTDGANEQGVNITTFTYPQTTTIGGDSVTWGWESSPNNGINGNTGVDPRLAGCHYKGNNGSQAVFRVDLNAVGSHRLSLALGPAAGVGDQSNQYAQFRDTTTAVLTVNKPGAVVEDHYYDATGVDRTSAAWPGSHATVDVTLTTTILRLAIATPGADGGNTTLAHIAIEQLAGPAGPPAIYQLFEG